MRIAHCADIHWRSLSRHDEYRKTFERMFEDMQLTKPDLIIVCGDIVHSKTQGITPELIDHLVWWFSSLSKIAPVHVTLGNHDLNLANLTRQDAISPIINAMNNPRVFLHKNSGVFKIAPNVNLCVFSICDNDGWKNVKPVKNEINIATFHGVVAGSKNDQGWAFESELNAEFFKPYDFTILGDIHVMQNIETRDFEQTVDDNELEALRRLYEVTVLRSEKSEHNVIVKKPKIAYSGNPIMNSYGEMPGKGYLLWTIVSKDDYDVEFRKIEHDSEFHTIDWQGNVQSTLSVAKQLPRGSRVRVRCQTLVPQIELEHISNELKTMYGATEVVFKDDYAVNTSQISIDDVTLEHHDLRDPAMMLKLFKSFFDEKSFSQKEWLIMKSLIDMYLARVNSEEHIVRNIRWSLKKLEFDNIFGYGADNTIDFSKLSGISGIFGQNRIGKSSIVGTILYTIFNGTDRGALKNIHLINTRHRSAKAAAYITINDRSYVINRQTVKHFGKSETHAVTHLNFAEVDAKGKFIRDLNGEQRIDTEKSIRMMLGTLEDCMLTSISTQGDMNRFIDAGSASRDNVISRFLDLIVFDKLYDAVKVDASIVKAEIKNAPDKDWDTLIKSKQSDVTMFKSEIVRLESLLCEKREKLDALRLQLAMKNVDGMITPSDVDCVRSNIKKLETIIESLTMANINASSSLAECNREKNKNEKQLKKIDIALLQKNKQKITELKDHVSVFKQKYEKEKQLLSSQEKSIENLLKVPCGDTFPTCVFIKSSQDNKKKLKQQKQLLNEIIKDVDTTESLILELNGDEIDKEIKRHSEISRALSDNEMTAVKLASDIKDVDRQLTHNKTRLIDENMTLTDYISRVVDVKLSDDCQLIKNEIAELRTIIEQLDRTRISAASDFGRGETEIARLDEEKKKFKTLKLKWRIYEMFMSAVSKRGIQAQIVNSQLPAINSEIAKILHGVVDYTIRLEKPEDSQSTETYIDYGDSKRIIELASGMEKMIASLAIRVALLSASSLPKPDFMIIDEGFGALDESSVEACNRLLVSLKKYVKNIIVISHVDAVKDIADNTIDVELKGKDSYVSIK